MHNEINPQRPMRLSSERPLNPERMPSLQEQHQFACVIFGPDASSSSSDRRPTVATECRCKIIRSEASACPALRPDLPRDRSGEHASARSYSPVRMRTASA